MKQILTIGLLLSLLTGVPAGQAQPKARKSAIAGKILFESYHAVQNPPVPPIERNIDPKLLKPMPVHIDLVPDSSRTPPAPSQAAAGAISQNPPKEGTGRLSATLLRDGAAETDSYAPAMDMGGRSGCPARARQRGCRLRETFHVLSSFTPTARLRRRLDDANMQGICPPDD